MPNESISFFVFILARKRAKQKPIKVKINENTSYYHLAINFTGFSVELKNFSKKLIEKALIFGWALKKSAPPAFFFINSIKVSLLV